MICVNGWKIVGVSLSLAFIASCNSSHSLETLSAGKNCKNLKLAKSEDCNTTTTVEETSSTTSDVILTPDVSVEKTALTEARVKFKAKKGVSYRILYGEGELTASQLTASSGVQVVDLGEAQADAELNHDFSEIKLDQKVSYLVEAKRGAEVVIGQVVQLPSAVSLTGDWRNQSFGQQRESNCHLVISFGQRTFYRRIGASGMCQYNEFNSSGKLDPIFELNPSASVYVFGDRLIAFQGNSYTMFDQTSTVTNVTWLVSAGLGTPVYRYANAQKIFLVFKETATTTRRLFVANYGESTLTELVSFTTDAYSAYASKSDGSIAFAIWGNKVYVSDGTVGGTRIIRNGGTFQTIMAIDDDIYFSEITNGIFKAQFSGSGTATSFYAGFGMGAPYNLNGRMIFYSGTTLYAYDPADSHSGSCVANSKLAPATGTGCIIALRTGLVWGFPQSYQLWPNGYGQMPSTVGSYLVFFADDGTNGPELWQTDGTVAGTTLKFSLTAGSAGFSSTARLFKIEGVPGVFFQSIAAGQNVSIWHYSNSANAPVLLTTYVGSEANLLSTDANKQKIFLHTNDSQVLEIPITGGTIKKTASWNLGSTVGINEDGFYFVESHASGGALKRRNVDRSVDTISGLTLESYAFETSTFTEQIFKKLSGIGTIFVGCQTTTDCDLYSINGSTASVWAEYPDSSIPNSKVVSLGSYHYVTDNTNKLTKISDNGTNSYVQYSGSNLTQIVNLNPAVSDEIVVMNRSGVQPSKLYRINAASNVSLIYTANTVANADFYGLSETIRLGVRRLFYEYAFDWDPAIPVYTLNYTSLAPTDSVPVADTLTLKASAYTAPYIVGSKEVQEAVVWRNRRYYICYDTSTTRALCSVNLANGDQRVESTGSSGGAPILSGNRLYFEKLVNGIYSRSSIDSSDVVSAIPLPSGVTENVMSQAATVNGYMIFAGKASSTGVELYITDGVTTRLFADIESGPNSSDPRIIGISGNELVVEVNSNLNRGIVFYDVSAFLPQ